MDKAGFEGIRALAIGPDGAIYVAELKTIRRIHKGQVTTLAGDDSEPPGYVDGPVASARFNDIGDIILDTDGSLLVTEALHIRRLRNGQVTTIAGTGKPKDYPYYSDGPALGVYIALPLSILVEGSDIIFSSGGAMIRKLSQGNVTTIAGAEEHPSFARDGPLSTARFSDIWSLTRYKGAQYFVSWKNSRVRSIVNGEVKTLNMPAKNNGKLAQTPGLRDGPLKQALFDSPSALAADARGNLYVADTFNCRIRYIEIH